MKQVLFVCTGNTCRSPMASAICEYICNKKDIECISDSCGISTADGLPASENAVSALRELYNVDLSAHRSKQITDELVKRADIIFTMSQMHSQVLLFYFPECKDKIICAEPEISDPYMSNLNVYKACAKELYEQIDSLNLGENK